MKSLNEITTKAANICAANKQSVDVYKTDIGFACKLTSSRNSKNYLRRLSHEGNKIVVVDQKGKKLDTFIVDETKTKQAKKAPAEKPESVQGI